MARQPQARHSMMIFVATIFILACLIAVYFAAGFHPGDPSPVSSSAISSMSR